MEAPAGRMRHDVFVQQRKPSVPHGPRHCRPEGCQSGCALPIILKGRLLHDRRPSQKARQVAPPVPARLSRLALGAAQKLQASATAHIYLGFQYQNYMRLCCERKRRIQLQHLLQGDQSACALSPSPLKPHACTCAVLHVFASACKLHYRFVGSKRLVVHTHTHRHTHMHKNLGVISHRF